MRLEEYISQSRTKKQVNTQYGRPFPECFAQGQKRREKAKRTPLTDYGKQESNVKEGKNGRMEGGRNERKENKRVGGEGERKKIVRQRKTKYVQPWL